MSTESKTSQNVPTRLAKARSDTDMASAARPSIVEKIDINALQIDESFDVDCDPYNSRGQFLTDALRKRYED
jgi:hypothetical protein